MIIKEFQGKHGQLRYHLFNDDDSFIAWFDSLWDAAAVARYLAGANMGDDERQRAIAAMQDSQVARTLGRTLNAAKKKRKQAAGDAEQTNDDFEKGF